MSAENSFIEDIEKIAEKSSRFTFPDAGGSAPSKVRSEIIKAKRANESERKRYPLLYRILGSGTPPYKFSKNDVYYTDDSDVKGKTCGNCDRSYQHVNSKSYICDWMSGEIKPGGWCDRWTK